MSTYLRNLGLACRPDPHEVECQECLGTGYFLSDNGPSPRETECETCGGSGYLDGEDEA